MKKHDKIRLIEDIEAVLAAAKSSMEDDILVHFIKSQRYSFVAGAVYTTAWCGFEYGARAVSINSTFMQTRFLWPGEMWEKGTIRCEQCLDGIRAAEKEAE